MAGGFGKRLWPLSTKSRPKQFLQIFAGKSSFQLTILRNQFLGNPTILTNKAHLHIAQQQIKELDLEMDVILESCCHNTAASAIIAAHFAKLKKYQYLILLPCDHCISNQALYAHTLKQATQVVTSSNMITIGSLPDKFSSAFGYIYASRANDNIFNVKSFKEKPASITTHDKLSLNTYFWNLGIYLINTQHLLNNAQKLCIYSYHMISNALKDSMRSNNIYSLSHHHYQHINLRSFDFVFAERCKNMQMVEAKFLWKDIGSIESLLNITDMLRL